MRFNLAEMKRSCVSNIMFTFRPFFKPNPRKLSKLDFMTCTVFMGLLLVKFILRGGGSRTSDVIFAFKRRVISATKPETQSGLLLLREKCIGQFNTLAFILLTNLSGDLHVAFIIYHTAFG